MMKRGALGNHLQSLFAAATLATVTLLSTPLLAQTVALNNSLTSAQGKKWSLPVVLTTESNTYKEGTYERSASTALLLLPAYRFSPAWSVGMKASFYRDETSSGDSAAGDTGFGNTSLSLTYSRKLTESAVWKTSGLSILPTSRKVQDQTSFQGAAGLSTGVLITDLVLDSSLGYKISFLRNFHEFERSADDSANVRETLGQTIDFALPLGKSFSFESSFSYSQGLTYQNDTRHKFGLGADLIWAATKSLSLSVGMTNEGEALKPNGYQSNIEFYDEKTSMVNLGLTYVL